MEKKALSGGLQRYLMKCELEYRAKMLPGGSCVDWLGEHCGSTKEIAEFLQELGFVIQTIEDRKNYGFVTTTNGVIVLVNDRFKSGMVCGIGY